MALNPERVSLRGSVDQRRALCKKVGECVASGQKPLPVRTSIVI
jgi:hypothetical protein